MGLYCVLCGRNRQGSENRIGDGNLNDFGKLWGSKAGPHYLVLGLGQVDSGSEEVVEVWALN